MDDDFFMFSGLLFSHRVAEFFIDWSALGHFPCIPACLPRLFIFSVVEMMAGEFY